MLEFFDCHAAVGCWKHPRYGGFETADELESVLDHLRVEKAIVYHAFAREGHAPAGNAMLTRALAGHPRLLPCWVVLPHHTGEMPEPRSLVRDMFERNVRWVRMFPGKAGHGFSLEPWCSGALLSVLAEYKVPVAIDFTLFRRDDPDWGLVHSLCRRYPALPVILAGQGIGRAARTFFALFDACPNLHIELSSYTPFRGIEAICRHAGALRLLYGSGLPLVATGAAMTSVTHAAIGDEERALIASGNVRRLLAEVIL